MDKIKINMKAFLSHSSKDKEFVEAVAKELGRQFCVFDKQVFQNGEEFKSSIENGLNDSSLFVLFASQESLKSVWVEFEIEEAWYKRLNRTLSGSLVYIIDSSVRIENVPEWLRRARIQPEHVPKRLARDIRHHLNELQRQRQSPYFVGRTSELGELEESLTPIYSPPPHVACIVGLPGIGRRSLIREKVPSVLNLKKHIEIRIGEGDSINDICLAIADHAEPYSTIEGYRNIIQSIRALTDERAIERIITNLRSLVTAGELPIFLDDGGLLDEDGYLRMPITTILKSFALDDPAYLFFVTQRRPKRSGDYQFPVIMLKPLGENETRRLLGMLAKNANIEIEAKVIEDIAGYVSGYPPAAYFAIQQIKDYGIEVVVREKAQLVQFTTSVFLRHLTTFVLNETESTIMSLLSLFSPLPLPVIADVVSRDLADVDPSLIRLIDLALVTPTPNGHYRIADPVANASLRSFGFPSISIQKLVAEKLSEYLNETEVAKSHFELSRVLFRSAVLAGDNSIASQADFLANDIIRLAETNYHSRNYEEAERLGYEAVKLRPDNISARRFLVRSLIQREKWDEAELQLHELERIAEPRVVLFLRGFLERRRGNLHVALELFKRAANEGRDDAALNRELALCFYKTGDPAKALGHVQNALTKENNNWYLLDLWAQIGITLGDHDQTLEALKRLELVADKSQYNHRLSGFKHSIGDLPGALAASRTAVESHEDPVFEVMARLVYLEIASGNLNQASSLLARLDKRFGSVRKDIRIALRCRYEIATRNFKSALALSEQIKDKTTPFYRRIRLDSLKGELESSALPDTMRKHYEYEAEQLDLELSEAALREFALFPLE